MDYRKRYFIATVVLGVMLGLVFWGFGQLRGEAIGGRVSWLTIVVFFGAAITGIIAAISRQYLRSKLDSDVGRKIEMDALGAIGKQMLEEKHRKQNENRRTPEK